MPNPGPCEGFLWPPFVLLQWEKGGEGCLRCAVICTLSVTRLRGPMCWYGCICATIIDTGCVLETVWEFVCGCSMTGAKSLLLSLTSDMKHDETQLVSLCSWGLILSPPGKPRPRMSETPRGLRCIHADRPRAAEALHSSTETLKWFPARASAGGNHEIMIWKTW